LISGDNTTEIPEYFKINSRPVRFELLAGMLSEGGEIKDERVYLYHPNYNFCKEVQWVARSLGLTAKVRKVSDNTKEKIDSNEYQVIIFGKNIAEITFIFSKEEEHYSMFKNSNFFKFRVKYVGEGEYYGIRTESANSDTESERNLFLLDSFDIVEG
jgi:hypothetical protein